MSAAAESAPARPPQAFSGGAVLALVLVGVVAFAGLAVLSAYAPDLRGHNDVRAHALRHGPQLVAGVARHVRRPVAGEEGDRHVVAGRRFASGGGLCSVYCHAPLGVCARTRYSAQACSSARYAFGSSAE